MKLIVWLANIITVVMMLSFATFAFAQDNETQNETQKVVLNKKTVSVDAPANKTTAPATDKSNKKMVQEATINLQTTVTGNQEQPRVLYILPWQSPAAEEVDFESLENQQKAVFSHVEREELRRELESVGE